jgi:hypothetical protein
MPIPVSFARDSLPFGGLCLSADRDPLLAETTGACEKISPAPYIPTIFDRMSSNDGSMGCWGILVCKKVTMRSLSLRQMGTRNIVRILFLKTKKSSISFVEYEYTSK